MRPDDRPTRFPRGRQRVLALTALAAATGLAVTACSGSGHHSDPLTTASSAQPVTGVSMMKLTAFDSCDALLHDYRSAALQRLAAHPAPQRTDIAPAEAAPAAPGAASTSTDTAAPDVSSTTVQEQGVDEPDLVKTDGRRIVTVVDQRLRVYDAVTHQQTGDVELPGPQPTYGQNPQNQLLLSGNRALVIEPGMPRMLMNAAGPQGSDSSGTSQTASPQDGPLQSHIVLVDLSGAPRVLGDLAVQGAYVDARATGTTARVVVRTQDLGPQGMNGPDAAADRTAVQDSTIADWLPSYTLTTPGAQPTKGSLYGCNALSRPASPAGSSGHSDQSTMSVLTFDLTHDLTAGDGIGVAADATFVYGAQDNLYVAAPYSATTPATANTVTQEERTAVYRFDISGGGHPALTATGDVPGGLINAYSMSEYNGELRVATTVQGVTVVRDGTGPQAPVAATPQAAQSQVTVLDAHGSSLDPVGTVTGIGTGETIKAVRFLGPTAYVVTYRQTDPLFTVDLSDPAHPRETGRLTVDGYSGFLAPTSTAGRLIGVGQNGTGTGQTTGVQVSLFDVSDPAAPARLSQATLAAGTSTPIDTQPHAYLYMPSTGTIVVPVTTPRTSGYQPLRPGANVDPVPAPAPMSTPSASPGNTASAAQPAPMMTTAPTDGYAYVLHLNGDTLTVAGSVEQPGSPDILRSVVIGDELWTVSDTGVQADNLDTLAATAWFPVVAA